jgi:hypothetical protein
VQQDGLGSLQVNASSRTQRLTNIKKLWEINVLGLFF